MALADHSVKSYSLEDGEDEVTVCRFSANVTCLALDAEQQYLVAGAA